jgi:hypothetical protein
MKDEKETGVFRRQWNYFKRGKGELNFLLNVYQTLVLIWGVDVLTKDNNTGLIVITVLFGVFIFTLSLIIGKYSLVKVDPTLVFLNPFAQDIVIFRKLLASGLFWLVEGDKGLAQKRFAEAMEITEKWTAER